MSGAQRHVGPRRTVRSGIQASHSFEVTERRIGSVVYQFCRHHHLMSPGHEGIQVWVKPAAPLAWGQKPVQVMSVGEAMPQSRGY